MQSRLRDLFEKYMGKTATTAEREELGELLATLPQEERSKLLTDAWDNAVDPTGLILPENVSAHQLSRILTGKRDAEPAKLVYFSRRLLTRSIAVAVLLLIIGATYLYISPVEQNLQKKAANIAGTPKTTTAPASQGAILTLGDGSSIVLDSIADGVLSQKMGVTVVKGATGLIYEEKETAGNVLPLNTIATPRGRQYQLSLADGTKVWLNAATKLKFPTAFTHSKERVVELEGEAYFEVAQNATKPFIVKLNGLNGNGSSIKVLGTSFNVQSYNDEPVTYTTLLSGAVQFNMALEKLLLQPGQQSSYSPLTGALVKTVDISEVVAWKNGMFQFSNTDLKTVMRQLSRWYDMDVVYEGDIPPFRFKGKIQRDLNLEDVIAILEADVDIRIKEKTIVVASK